MHIHGESDFLPPATPPYKSSRLELNLDGKTILPSGATRDSDVDHLRYDLISPYGLRALAKIYCQGAKRHGDRNWEKGQPTSVVLNHAMEHLMKYMTHYVGDTEDHLAKVAWAMFALIHFRDNPDYNKVDWEETG